MKSLLITPATLEPISLSEMKSHCVIDSESFDGNLTLTQSLSYGSHAVAAEYVTHVGTGIDVLGKQADVILSCGTNGATGTVDTVIQESDLLATGYTNWGTAFTQVTTASDNTDYKKQYTGSKRYIRTASKVLLAACEFGTSILVNAAVTPQDALLTDILLTAREIVEDQTRRQLLTATWEYYPQCWPKGDKLKLPFGNLQSITSIKYKDTAGTETTLTLGTDYLLETNGEACGAAVLPYGESWPSDTLYPSNPITIKYICGWTAAALIPSKIKTAIKMIAADLYENREAQISTNSTVQAYTPNKVVSNMLLNCTLWEEL